MSAVTSHASFGPKAHACACSFLAAALDVELTVSGHMGSPYGFVWDDFAVRETAEAETRGAGR